MQGRPIFVIIGLVALLGTVAANYACPPLPIATPHRLPIETFPERIGIWRASADTQFDPTLAQALPTAQIVGRTYTSPSGQTVDLLLVTASDRDDIHDPRICFPSQGWHTVDSSPVHLGSQTVQTLVADQDGQDRTNVWYWFTGYYPPALNSPFLKQVTAIRTKFVGRQEGMSLFVRLMADDTPRGNEAIRAFTAQIAEPLHNLTASRS